MTILIRFCVLGENKQIYSKYRYNTFQTSIVQTDPFSVLPNKPLALRVYRNLPLDLFFSKAKVSFGNTS